MTCGRGCEVSMMITLSAAMRRRCISSAGTAGLLPRRCDRAGVAHEDRRLQSSDVDAQLERVGADHAGDGARAETGFDLPAMQGQVARAVAADALVRVEPRREVLAQVAQH